MSLFPSSWLRYASQLRLHAQPDTSWLAFNIISRHDDPGGVTAGQLASALRSIGYRPRVITNDAQFYQRLARGQWDIGGGDSTADYPSPAQFLDYFLSCANYHPGDPADSTNGGGFCNPQFDRLVTQAETLQPADPAAAQDLSAKADHLAVSQAAWVPLANTGSADLLSRRAGNFTLDASSNPRIDQLWIR